jgi:predicted Zn-dependent protease with MMP-like domain
MEAISYILVDTLALAAYAGIPAALLTACLEVYVKMRNKKRKQNEDYWNPRA